MQGIYTYIPETNHVPREYSVSAILSLLFMVSISLVPTLALLYFYVSTFRSMCAVPNMAVFCSSFTSWYLVCCLCIFWMILKRSQSLLLLLVSPLFFTFHMRCISIVLLLLLLLLLWHCITQNYADLAVFVCPQVSFETLRDEFQLHILFNLCRPQANLHTF
jgi:hypothetical protein